MGKKKNNLKSCISISQLPMHLDDAGNVAFSGNNSFSVAQFKNDIRSLASALKQREEYRWALCFKDSYQFAVALLACCHADKHLVLPGNYQAGALAELNDYFDALLCDLPLTSQLPDAAQIRLPYTSTPPNIILTELVPEAIPLTLFTSGSSGVPKAVSKHLGLLDCEIQQLEQLWGTQLRGCKVVSTVSHQHIYGLLFRILWPLCSARSFSCDNLEYPEQIMVSTHTDTCLISSPALLKRLSNETPNTPFRQIFSSGGPLSQQAAEDCHRLFTTFPIEIFGSTETGGIAFRQQNSKKTAWHLFPEHDMFLSEDASIVLKSAFIHPDNCQQGWYHTCDCAQMQGKKSFQLLGRNDRVLKIEEKRISLAEVERHLNNLAWLKDAAALSIDDNKRLSIAAIICLSEMGKAALEQLGKGKFNIQLRSQLRRFLEPVGIPRRFRILDEIPINSQGKRQFQVLKQLFSDASEEHQTEKNKMDRSLPELLSSSVDNNTAKVELQPESDLTDFQGHFPQYALLPGVTQIDWAIRFGAQLLQTPKKFSGMEVVKFQEPIEPGTKITLTLNWEPKKQKLTFNYHSHLGVHSSGRIKLEIGT